MRTRNKVVVVALIGAVLASLAITVGYVSAPNPMYASAIWSKSYGYGAWIEPTGWTTLLSITLPSFPSLYYHVSCDGYAYLQDGVELEIAIGVDSPTEDASTRRFYGVGEMYTGLHTERVFKLGAGSHTFYFLATRYAGTGVPRINYMTITVTVYTDGGLTLLASTTEVGGPPNGIVE